MGNLKLNLILALFIVVLSSTALAEDIIAPNWYEKWFLGSNTLYYKGIQIIPMLDSKTEYNARSFDWVIDQENKSFYPTLNTNLTEFHYLTTKLETETECYNVNQYYKTCFKEVFNDNKMVYNPLNNLTYHLCGDVNDCASNPFLIDGKTPCQPNIVCEAKINKTILPIIDSKDGAVILGYDIGYYGLIRTLDPAFEQVYSSSSNLIGNGTDFWRNNTQATNLGVHLMMNVSNWTLTGEPVVGAYNFTNGWFNSLVFYNSTSTYWNVSLSLADSNGSAEVLDLCANDNNCVAYYPLDSRFGNNVSMDAKGVNHGTPTGTNNATGLSSGAMRFDGVDDIINFGDINSFDGATKLTFSGWITRQVATAETILSRGSPHNANGIILYTDGTYLIFRFYKSVTPASNYGEFKIIDDPLTVGKMVHVVATVDLATETAQFYVNGNNYTVTKYESGTGMPSSIGTSTDTWALGARPAPSSFFKGVLDEVLLFNNTLSYSEANALYKSGLSQHANTNITLQTRVATNYNLSDVGLVSQWDFNDDYTDAVGNNDGTNSGSTRGESYGVVGQGAYFDGVNDYINLTTTSSVALAGKNFTVSSWSRHNNIGKFEGIISKNKNTGVLGWVLAKRNTNVYSFTLSSGTATSINSLSAYTDNNWHHIVGVYDGTNSIGYLYVDGAYQGSGTKAFSDSTGFIQIGKYYIDYDGYYMNGSIDEVRIYNRSLSASEVQNLYELGSYHIEWNDWEDEGTLNNSQEYQPNANASFIQFKYNFNTNDTDVSPYVLNHSIHPNDKQQISDVITDTTKPSFNETYTNQSLRLYYDILYIDINASDDNGIDRFWVNDTTNFNISFNGILINKTLIPVGTYYINISVNDTYGNINSTYLNVNITEVCVNSMYGLGITGDECIIEDCDDDLTKDNLYYRLGNDLDGTGLDATCLDNSGSNISFNLYGYKIQGDSSGVSGACTSFNGDNITIFNGTLYNCGNEAEGGDALKFEGTTNAYAYNLIINNSYDYGINLINSMNITMHNLTLNQAGAKLFQTNSSIMTNSKIYLSPTDGLNLDTLSNFTLYETNISSATGLCIHLNNLKESNYTFKNNNLSSCNTGTIGDDDGTYKKDLIYRNEYAEWKWNGTDMDTNSYLTTHIFKLSDNLVNITGDNMLYDNFLTMDIGWIELYNIGDRGFIEPVILQNGIECTTCVNYTSLEAETVIFTEDGLSGAAYYWSIGERPDSTFPHVENATATTAYCSQAVTFSANITDNIGITSARVWINNTANTYFNYGLYNAGGNLYQNNSFAVTNAGTYWYKINATDSSGNKNDSMEWTKYIVTTNHLDITSFTATRYDIQWAKWTWANPSIAYSKTECNLYEDSLLHLTFNTTNAYYENNYLYHNTNYTLECRAWDSCNDAGAWLNYSIMTGSVTPQPSSDDDDVYEIFFNLNVTKYGFTIPKKICWILQTNSGVLGRVCLNATEVLV